MLAKFSVKKPYTVIVGILLVIVLGAISFANMTTDLLPNMNMPYVAVYTTYVGATPEQVEDEITRPMEASFATLTDIKSINSTSSENLSLVVMEFESDTDIDSVMIELSSRIDMLRGEWSDSVGAPVVMKINPDMMPVSVASVSLEGADVRELTAFVDETLMPRLESIDGVASVSASGAVEEHVAVTIEQSRIDMLNSIILREVNEELADVERRLNDAQAQLSEGKRTLASERENVLGQIDDALAQLSGDTLEGALAQAQAQRDELSAQLEQTSQALSAMEALSSLTPEQKQQLDALNAQLASLRLSLAEKQAQLDALEGAVHDPDAQDRYDEAAARRDAALSERAQLEDYIEEQTMRDPEALRERIAQLEADVASGSEAVAAANAQVEQGAAQLEALNGRIAQLEAQIAQIAGETSPSPTPTSPVTEPPTSEPPTCEPPTSEAPTSEAPTSEAPTSQPPTSQPPVPESPSLVRRAPERSLLTWLGSLGAASAEEPSLEALERQLAQALEEREALDLAQGQAVSARDALTLALEEDEAALAASREALAQLEASGGGEDTQERIEEARSRIAALDEEIAELEATMAQIEAGRLPDEERAQQIEALKGEIAQIEQSISAIEDSEAYKMLTLASDEDAYNAQYAQLSQAKAQLEAAVAQLDEAIAKLESGVIPGGIVEGVEEDTNLEDARAQLESARAQAVDAFSDAQSQLSSADSELAQARSEFYESRDEALENAGLDGVITMEMVSALIGAQNFSMPAGYVGDGDESYLVRVGDEFSSLDELRGMRLFSLGMESIDVVSLADVARVEIVDNSEEAFTKINGEDGILLSFQKQSNRSTADVAALVSETLDELSAQYEGLSFAELMNQGDYIDMVIDSVIDNLLYGAVLAVLVLLLFLMDFRPTLIIALSIPVSVVIAFVAMYFTGVTLNVLSLSGLALGIGMLVDNSIVAIENIYRLRNEEGMPVMRACIEGVKQISGALIASTLTTVCVFLPVVFVQGITRELFSDIGLTITYSLLASLLVSMTVVPTMSASVLKRSKPQKERFDRVRQGYAKLLRGALRVKPLILLVAVALLGFSVWQTMQMNMSFMPEVSSPQMTATLAFDRDMTDAQKREASLEVMDGMLSVPDVESVGMTSGSVMGIGGGGESLGESMTFYILLNEEMERENAQVAEDISALDTGGLELSVQTSSMDISMLSGEGISINIQGEDMDALRTAAAEVADIVRGIEGASDISDGLEQSEPELTVRVDKTAANEEGLTVAQVYQFVATKLAGEQEITQITLDGKEYPVTVAEQSNLDLTAQDVANLEIEVAGEEETKHVRIGDIAQIEETMSLSSINRRDQRRTVTVSFNAADGYALSRLSDELEARLADYTPPEGCTVSLSGENETVRSIMEDLVLVIAVAIVFIFLIMVAQFQSFKSPIIVMFTIPLAFTGGLLALLITGMDLSVVAMVGFLMLSGVVVNNGIVFVDCVNQLRIGGMSKREALVETGKMRLRPILMTALTTILGMSTMALGTGMGAEMMQPMAIVSIGGLIYATLMTLFVVPVLYDLFNGEKMKAREIEMIREAAGLRDEAELLGEQQTEATPHAPALEATGDAPSPAPQSGATDAASAAQAPPAPEAAPATEAPPATEVAPATEAPSVTEAPIATEASPSPEALPSPLEAASPAPEEAEKKKKKKKKDGKKKDRKKKRKEDD